MGLSLTQGMISTICATPLSRNITIFVRFLTQFQHRRLMISFFFPCSVYVLCSLHAACSCAWLPVYFPGSMAAGYPRSLTVQWSMAAASVSKHWRTRMLQYIDTFMWYLVTWSLRASRTTLSCSVHWMLLPVACASGLWRYFGSHAIRHFIRDCDFTPTVLIHTPRGNMLQIHRLTLMGILLAPYVLRNHVLLPSGL